MKLSSIHPATSRVFLAVCSAVLIPGSAGCDSDTIDNSNPEATYESYRTAMQAGAWEKVYLLLIPEVKEKIAGTWELNQRTMRLIENNIPAALKANYLNETGSGAIRNAGTPAAYFAATLSPARGVPGDMGSAVSTKRAGIDEVPKGSNKWVVRTLGGERISIHGGTDGMYYVVPASADAARFNQELKNAGDRLVILQKISEDLGSANRTAQP